MIYGYFIGGPWDQHKRVVGRDMDSILVPTPSKYLEPWDNGDEVHVVKNVVYRLRWLDERRNLALYVAEED